MHYSFDIHIAEKYGVGEAIFLQNIAYWMIQNKGNNVNFYDGKFWTFNSQRAFAELFPFWSRQNLRRVIDSCKNQGLLLIGNYNKLPYDRTNWYTLSDQGLTLYPFIINQSICQTLGENQPRPGLELANVLVGTNPPIPNINTDNKQKIKDKIKAQPKKQVDAVTIELPNWLPNELWKEFKQHRKEMKKPMSELAQKKTINQLEKMKVCGQDIEAVINQSIANGWQGLFELKSQGNGYEKCNASTGSGRKEKFDATKYLLDSIRADESKENNRLFEDSLSFKDSEYLLYDGTSGSRC
jgi:hypothetical protein